VVDVVQNVQAIDHNVQAIEQAPSLMERSGFVVPTGQASGGIIL
jgi:hypothetical protein